MAKNTKTKRAWRKRNPEKCRTNYRRWICKKYGLSLEDYDRILIEQGGGCAICGGDPLEGRSLNIDHDHQTGVVRGLLCHLCNPGLGYFKDSEALLHRAIAYLRKMRSS